MTTMKKTNAAILGTTMLLAAGGAAMAQDQGTGNSSQAQMPKAEASEQMDMRETGAPVTNDGHMSKVTSAKVGLAQAVGAAEKAVGGKAVDVSILDEAGMSGWEVELVQSDGTMKTVLVDMSTGTVDQNPRLENGMSEGDDRDRPENRDGKDRAERGEYRDEGDGDGEYANREGERDHAEYQENDERSDEGGYREHRDNRDEGDDRDDRN